MEEQWPDTSLLRKWRQDLRLTQQKLAQVSGVPQSVISKIEDGKIADPSYSTTRKLFQALERFKKSKEYEVKTRILVAADVMNPKVVSVRPDELLKNAWSIMKRRDFSQLPVIDHNNRIVGGVAESDLVTENSDKLVRDVMGDSFPVVGINTKLAAIAVFIRTHHAVLVIDKGKIAGIITAYNLVENAYNKRPEELK